MIKIVRFFVFNPQSYSGSGCSKCSCEKFEFSDDPQFCYACGHSRSSHYGI